MNRPYVLAWLIFTGVVIAATAIAVARPAPNVSYDPSLGSARRREVAGEQHGEDNVAADDER
jgi:hypothetical protein